MRLNDSSVSLFHRLSFVPGILNIIQLFNIITEGTLEEDRVTKLHINTTFCAALKSTFVRYSLSIQLSLISNFAAKARPLCGNPSIRVLLRITQKRRI